MRCKESGRIACSSIAIISNCNSLLFLNESIFLVKQLAVLFLRSTPSVDFHTKQPFPTSLFLKSNIPLLGFWFAIVCMSLFTIPLPLLNKLLFLVKKKKVSNLSQVHNFLVISLHRRWNLISPHLECELDLVTCF